MLQAKHITVQLSGVKILDDVSFNAEPGMVIGLLGPNGSGKSTLIRSIVGLVKNVLGDIFYNELDVNALSSKKRARLFAYVPQNTVMGSMYTVSECVVMGRYPYLERFEHYGRDDFEIAKNSLARVGLAGFENRIVSTLSGGEAARVVCARALSQEAPIMILDEPTSAMDPKHSLAITSLIRQLAEEGKIVLVSMHDINLALNYTDSLILLKGGQVYGEMKARSVDEKVLEGLYDIPWEIWSTGEGEKLVAIPGSVSSPIVTLQASNNKSVFP